MSALVDQIAELHKSGVEIILISSGAVASGRSEVHPHISFVYKTNISGLCKVSGEKNVKYM